MPFLPVRDDPVFMVGAPRTASSFLCSALIEFAGFAGANEGHLLPLLSSLDAQIVGYYALVRKQGLLEIPGNAITRIPEFAMRHAILDVFRNYTTTMFGSARWVDKTVNVEMIEALPYLLQAWPRSRVVYLGRNGISNVQSAKAYFQVPFEECCLNWARCGEAWDRTRPQLPQDRVMEISHEDLLETPMRMAQSLSSWLGLSSASTGELINGIEAAVLEWSRGRPAPAVLEQVAWSPEEKRVFLRVCGEQMVAQGYLNDVKLTDLRQNHLEASVFVLPAASALPLVVDEPAFFRVEADSVLIVPGRERAAIVLYEDVRASGFRHLCGTLSVVHRESQGVRFEFIGVCKNTGSIVLKGTEEIAALEKRNFSFDFIEPCESMDIIVRVVRGAAAATNDFSWGQISNLYFSA